MATEGTRQGDFLVVGEALVDVVVGPAGTRRHPGGSPLNVAVGLGRLGDDVRLLTALGQDPDGDVVRRHLAESRVRLDPASTTAPRTSSATAVLDAAGAAAYTFDIGWDGFPAAAVAPARVVHSGSLATAVAPGAHAVADLLTRVREHALVTFDPNVRPLPGVTAGEQRSAVERFLALADVVKLSDEDAARLHPDLSVDEVLDAVLAQGPTVAVVTRGQEGAVLATPGHRLALPARRTTVVDTVGAGDSFMAGLLHVLGRLLRDGLDVGELRRSGLGPDAATRVLSLGLACGAATVGRAGADLPWLEELAEPA